MPFDKLGETLPDRQLMESFARRLSAAPKLDVLSGARVYTEAVSRYGAGALSNPEADTLAKQLGAKFFIQPSVVFTGTRSRLTARLYRARSGDVVAEADVEGSVDSLADMMTSVGRSEEHTSELQSLAYLVCRLLLEKKKKKQRGASSAHGHSGR